MSKRMTSETIIFDTDWLTEADFSGEFGEAVVSIDYQAYDTLKIIAPPEGVVLGVGGLFQEFDVYKLENFGPNYQILLSEIDEEFTIDYTKHEDYFRLNFTLYKSYWEDFLDGTNSIYNSIYIKGVKR